MASRAQRERIPLEGVIEMDKLHCTHCGSESLVGEISGRLFGFDMSIICIECGAEYSAPIEMVMHTDLERPFSEKKPSEYDEKNYKVSYKDTRSGDAATLISRLDNGKRLTRIYLDEMIG